MTVAVFVPSYCLYKDGTRLTAMTQASVYEAADIVRKNPGACVIFSTAYDVWEKEAELKQQLLTSLVGGLASGMSFIRQVTSTADEVREVGRLCDPRLITTVYVVAERWHAPRLMKTLRKCWPNITFVLRPFTSYVFERTLEPHKIPLVGPIKSIRAGNGYLWAAWNMLFNL
jgi:hypothetical protein